MPRTKSAPILGQCRLLDLNSIEEPRRADAWLQCIRAHFPGFSISDLCEVPKAGALAGTRLGSGRLWSIVSPQLRVNYDPAQVIAERGEIFSLVLQLCGCTVTRQGGRAAHMKAGHMCLVDSRLPFEMEVGGQGSELIILQMPRHAVLGRHPYLAHRTAESLDAEEPGACLLRSVCATIGDSAWTMSEHQRASVLAGVIQLLGAPEMSGEQRPDSRKRVRSALAYIDSRLSDPRLSAQRVANAQGMSRRRLDEIMSAATGASVACQIWLRRLEQAASDLRDPRFGSNTVTQIAFAAGFEDAAHFTRAFKRRYRCTPREWRRRPVAAPAVAELRVP